MKYRLREQLGKHSDTPRELADYLEITYETLSKKMNGHVEFSRAELRKIKNRYTLTAEQMDHIFFTD